MNEQRTQVFMPRLSPPVTARIRRTPATAQIRNIATTRSCPAPRWLLSSADLFLAPSAVTMATIMCAVHHPVHRLPHQQTPMGITTHAQNMASAATTYTTTTSGGAYGAFTAAV